MTVIYADVSWTNLFFFYLQIWRTLESYPERIFRKWQTADGNFDLLVLSFLYFRPSELWQWWSDPWSTALSGGLVLVIIVSVLPFHLGKISFYGFYVWLVVGYILVEWEVAFDICLSLSVSICNMSVCVQSPNFQYLTLVELDS